MLQPEHARALRLNLPDQSLDVVAIAIDEDISVLSRWERGLIRPGRRWDRIERKLRRYLAQQVRRKRPAQAVAS